MWGTSYKLLLPLIYLLYWSQNDVSKMQIWSYLFLFKIFRGHPHPHPSLRINSYSLSISQLLPKWPWFTCRDSLLTIVCFFLNNALLNFVSVPFTLFCLSFCVPFFHKILLNLCILFFSYSSLMVCLDIISSAVSAWITKSHMPGQTPEFPSQCFPQSVAIIHWGA